MAEENGGAPQIKMSVLAQFVRDMSFENMVAQKGLTATRSAAGYSGAGQSGCAQAVAGSPV